MESKTCTEAEPFALRVTDDSMEPEFKKGCVIIVDPTGRLEDGAFVLAEFATELLFRQLHRNADTCSLRPLNPRYPSTSIDKDMTVVLGVITQRAGPRRRDHKRYE